MSLCACEWRARCQYHHCTAYAEWSILTPVGRFRKAFPHGRLHFMCSRCRDIYVEAMSKPLKGIDRPEGADEEWKPSIMEHVRHARIAMEFEDRDKPRELEPLPVGYLDDYWREYAQRQGFTPAQNAQMMNLIARHRAVTRPQRTGSDS